MDEQVYRAARKLLKSQPGLGKKGLGKLLGIGHTAARRAIERWKGETEGDSPDPQYQAVKQLSEQNPSWGPKLIAKALGLPRHRARQWLVRLAAAKAARQGTKAQKALPTQTGQGSAGEWHHELNEQKGQGEVSYRGRERITTLEQLLHRSKVDLKVWKVQRWVTNKWEVGTRLPNGQIATAPLFQVKAWLERREEEAVIEQMLNGWLANLRKAAPKRKAMPHHHRTQGVLEVALMDHHLGKYCWSAEVGKDWNLELAKESLWGALEDLLGQTRSAGLRPEQILWVAGNDYLNTDNLHRTTTAGTPQDEIGRWKESWIEGRTLQVRAIERCREVAKVHVVVVPGNHDQERMYYLGDSLSCWFRGTQDVCVDNDAEQRKYYRYHELLLGFTHGNYERHADLPLLMPTEQPRAWAQTTHHEWHVGHSHDQQKKVFLPIRSSKGVILRVIPALVPPDAWHASIGKLYRPAAEAYFWEPDGTVTVFSHVP